MIPWKRVVYRARILTDRWVQHNAFTLGLVFGGALTLLVILVH
jgi:hypothetical protein